MKITKARLKEIIKEELGRVEKRVQYREDANDDTFEMVDAIVEAMGAEKALDNLVQAMERSAAHELLRGILQDYGIPMPGGEAEEY